jgi:hypothetical protein
MYALILLSNRTTSDWPRSSAYTRVRVVQLKPELKIKLRAAIKIDLWNAEDERKGRSDRLRTKALGMKLRF